MFQIVNKRRNKGVAPIISTVLLVSLVVSIAVVSNTWAKELIQDRGNQVRNQTDDRIECSYADILVYSSYYNDLTDATNVIMENTGTVDLLNISIATFSGDTVQTQNYYGPLTVGETKNISLKTEQQSDTIWAGSMDCPGISSETKVTPLTETFTFTVSGDWSSGTFENTTTGSPLTLTSDVKPVTDWTYTGHKKNVWGVAVDENGNVYSGGDNATVRRINPEDQSTEWQYNLSIGTTGRVSAVEYGNGTVYATATGIGEPLTAYNASTGSNKWNYTEPGWAVWDLDIDQEGNIYIADWNSVIHKLNTTGDKQWKYSDSRDFLRGIAVDDQGNVYTGDEDGGYEEIHKTNETDLIWSYSEHTDINKAVEIGPEGHIYSASGRELHKINSSSGTQLWKSTAIGASRGGGLDIGPNGSVYISNDGRFLKLNSSTGETIWNYPSTTYYGLDVDDNGAIYAAGTDSSVYKLAEDDVFNTSGTYTSKTFEAGSPANWSSVTVDAALSGENVTVQLEADSQNMTGEFGTEGETSDGFGLTNGDNEEFSPVLSDNYQYVRFQLELSTSDKTATPEIRSVEIQGEG